MNSSRERRVLWGGAGDRELPADLDRVEDLLYAMDGFPLTPEQKQAKEAGFRKGWDTGWEAAYAKGFAQGRDDAYREFGELLRPTVLAAEDAVRQLRAADRLTLDDIERSVMVLALEIVESLVGRHLEVTAAPVIDAIRRAIDLVPDRGRVRLRLNPDDVAIAQAVIEEIPRDFDIIADLSIERGGAIAEVGSCLVDAQIAPALERVRRVLRDSVGARP